MRIRLFVVCVISVITASVTPASAKTLRVTAAASCPFACDSQKHQGREGFQIDIIKAVFQDHYDEIVVDLLPWNRAVANFNNHRYDVLIAPTFDHLSVLDNPLFPQHTISHYRHAFYGKPLNTQLQSWQYAGIKSLKNLRLVARRNWSYCDNRFTSFVMKAPDSRNLLRIYGSNATPQIISLINYDRVDLAAINRDIADYYRFTHQQAMTTNQFSLIAAMPCEGNFKAYPAFNNTAMGEKQRMLFDQAMPKLRSSGRLAEILARYGLEDWL